MYWGDPDGVYDLPREKRLATIEYLISESDPDVRYAADSPVSGRELRKMLAEMNQNG